MKLTKKIMPISGSTKWRFSHLEIVIHNVKRFSVYLDYAYNKDEIERANYLKDEK
jgi:hypothetical protein